MGKVGIIGAGPAGTYAARLLAEQGHDVRIFEDHFKCGEPVQCTGILTHVGHELIDFDKKFIDNKIDSTIIFAPNGKFVEVNFKKPNIIVNRTKYDNHLLKKALDAGAQLHLGHRYLDSKWKAGRAASISVKDVKAGKIKKYKVDYLVGADGPNSTVAKTNDMFGERKFFIGAQATVKMKNQNQILFYPFVKDFAWAVPEDANTMRIGIAARQKASQTLKDFLKRFNGKIVAHQGGPIPIYDPSLKTQKKNVFLLGDAATQVKATTGGGIIQAMSAGKALATSLEKNEKKPDYDKEWRKLIGKDLLVHLMMRRILDRLKPNEWNKLVDTFSSDTLSQVLGEEDRDKGVKLAMKCVLKKPSLAFYGRRLMF